MAQILVQPPLKCMHKCWFLFLLEISGYIRNWFTYCFWFLLLENINLERTQKAYILICLFAYLRKVCFFRSWRRVLVQHGVCGPFHSIGWFIIITYWNQWSDRFVNPNQAKLFWPLRNQGGEESRRSSFCNPTMLTFQLDPLFFICRHFLDII